ncbi:hypothetical protein KEM56_006793 [Ascosphaera pollenicola]|nr:hypothetical protein KEM56_006793 [Ascosphaera pollenicola]
MAKGLLLRRRIVKNAENSRPPPEEIPSVSLGNPFSNAPFPLSSALNAATHWTLAAVGMDLARWFDSADSCAAAIKEWRAYAAASVETAINAIWASEKAYDTDASKESHQRHWVRILNMMSQDVDQRHGSSVLADHGCLKSTEVTAVVVARTTGTTDIKE